MKIGQIGYDNSVDYGMWKKKNYGKWQMAVYACTVREDLLCWLLKQLLERKAEGKWILMVSNWNDCLANPGPIYSTQFFLDPVIQSWLTKLTGV